MHPIIQKSFGGLTGPYYFRHFAFGLIFPAILLSAAYNKPEGVSILGCILVVLNTFIYPYSRFVYESVIEFIVGENVFFLNAFIVLAFKLITMLLCWFFAIFIAPIGLLYLYFYHSKNSA